jgi:hypothetical protein
VRIMLGSMGFLVTFRRIDICSFYDKQVYLMSYNKCGYKFETLPKYIALGIEKKNLVWNCKRLVCETKYCKDFCRAEININEFVQKLPELERKLFLFKFLRIGITRT